MIKGSIAVGMRLALSPAGACPGTRIVRILSSNKTRQGYARKRILKPAGYFFAGRIPAGG